CEPISLNYPTPVAPIATIINPRNHTHPNTTRQAQPQEHTASTTIIVLSSSPSNIFTSFWAHQPIIHITHLHFPSSSESTTMERKTNNTSSKTYHLHHSLTH
ncbi:hypothetical protein V8G54_012757, partial [Vigna mungo]